MFTTLSADSHRRVLVLLLPLLGLVVVVFMMPLLSGASPALTQDQANCPSLENTPGFTIVYGQVALDDAPASAGSIVEARSPRDDLVGCFEVAAAGYYGAMYIYGEDNTVTPSIPGMRAGEPVSFRVAGASRVPAPPTRMMPFRNDD